MRHKRNDQRLIQGLINSVNLKAIMTEAPTQPEIHAQILRRKHQLRRAMEEIREQKRVLEEDIY
jgi:hypothetical protein